MSWQAFCERVDLSRFPFKIDLWTDFAEQYGVRIRVQMHVPCVNTHKMTSIKLLEPAPEWSDLGRSEPKRACAAYHFIHGLLMRGLEHELDEALFIDDKRVKDPHAGDFR